MNTGLFGEAIYVYSRAQAIADGVLVDVTETAKEAGFSCPVALTASVWSDCVAWRDEDTKRQTPQDESGRLWDVLWMARQVASTSRQGSRVAVPLHRVPPGGYSVTPRPVVLQMSIGPGDDGEAIITIMLPDED